jgi:hypothetical protein
MASFGPQRIQSCICQPTATKNVRILCSVSNVEKMGPVLMDGTVISDVYLSMLRAVCSVYRRTPSDFSVFSRCPLLYSKEVRIMPA